MTITTRCRAAPPIRCSQSALHSTGPGPPTQPSDNSLGDLTSSSQCCVDRSGCWSRQISHSARRLREAGQRSQAADHNATDMPQKRTKTITGWAAPHRHQWHLRDRLLHAPVIRPQSARLRRTDTAHECHRQQCGDERCANDSVESHQRAPVHHIARVCARHLAPRCTGYRTRNHVEHAHAPTSVT
jgi:hypothetical protein